MVDPQDLDDFVSQLMPRLAGRAREGFANPGPLRFKSRGQIVTQIDADIEQTAREAIQNTWPDHAVLGEEAGWSPGAGRTTWFIDPIDGTMNFAHGIPFFSISIGVFQEGRMVVGHVCDPLREEHFHASLGKRAWLGSEPIQVSEVRELAGANLSMQTTSGSRFVREPGIMLELHRQFQKTRKFGSIALEMAYVACGRLDFILAGDVRPQPWWDIAGGWTLIEEAGGAVLDLDGEPVTEKTTHLLGGRLELIQEFRNRFASLAP